MIYGQHAAEILRPRAIDRAVDDDMTDALGAQLLWVWRDSEECVNLAVNKQLLRADFGAAGDPVDLRLGVDADIGGNHRQEKMLDRSHRPNADFLPSELRNAAHCVLHEQLEAADVNPDQRLHCDATIYAGDQRRGVVPAEVDRALRDLVGHSDV